LNIPAQNQEELQNITLPIKHGFYQVRDQLLILIQDTVRTHLRRVMAKKGVANRASLAAALA